MLILSRKGGEAVAVGERNNSDQLLKVTVLEINKSRVKLGFEAANDVPVHRWEVWERIKGQNGDVSNDEAARKKSAGGWEHNGGLSTGATEATGVR